MLLTLLLLRLEKINIFCFYPTSYWNNSQYKWDRETMKRKKNILFCIDKNIKAPNYKSLFPFLRNERNKRKKINNWMENIKYCTRITLYTTNKKHEREREKGKIMYWKDFSYFKSLACAYFFYIGIIIIPFLYFIFLLDRTKNIQNRVDYWSWMHKKMLYKSIYRHHHVHYSSSTSNLCVCVCMLLNNRKKKRRDDEKIIIMKKGR